jgi:transposase-like protein
MPVISAISAPYLHDEGAAFAHLESILWPEGPACPHCGSISGKHYDLRKARVGLRKCSDCRKQFTVKVGTVFESAHIPLHKMLQAVYLLCSSKKGISSHQLHRILGIQYNSAWFLTHRIREAFRSGELAPMGGDGGDVEVDETFVGRDPDARPTPKHAHASWPEKIKILSLIDRNNGRAKSFVVDSLSAENVRPIIRQNISKEARLMTDEAKRYVKIGREFAAHGTVDHSKDEYISSDDSSIHVNNLEGFFSIFKRGMKGVYQHASKRHLHSYTAEFDFRYSNRIALGVNDHARTARALQGITGKRLSYRAPIGK